MCGICGFYLKSKKDFNLASVIEEMNNSIVHRGPDSGGIFTDENFAIAARRLSIIDLHGGEQPIYNEDKSLWIVFNGEIYNYLELRNNLQDKGHKFYTHSDTEVILHLYEEYKEETPNYLRGMFVFAIYDKNNKKLFLARDRFGIKPLYYSYSDNNFIFASEKKAILKFPDFNKEIDLKALDNYLTFIYTQADLTFYKNIKKLLPGHYLILKNNELIIKQYYKINIKKNNNVNEDEAGEKLFYLLKDAVKHHLISDVPVGVFLSGGLDSSSIVALIREVTNDKINTFSIGFDEPSFDELKYARVVAKKFSTQHCEKILNEEYVINKAKKIVDYFDEPFADPSAIPTYLISEIVGSKLKVVLSGDGGDELFAGYDWFRKEIFLNYIRKLPIPKIIKNVPLGISQNLMDRIFRFIYDAEITPKEGFLRRITCFSPYLKDKLYSSNLKSELNNFNTYYYFENYFNNKLHNNIFDKLLFVDFSLYLPDDILKKVDSMSMANSLEVRPPFLDHNVVEYIFSLPFNLKYKNFTSKYILKKIMQNKLPVEILKQRKQGFSIPIDQWLKNKLKKWGEEILFSNQNKQNYFNKKFIKWMWDKHQQNKIDFGYQLWTIIVLNIWLDTL